MKRQFHGEDQEAFRATVRQFVDREVAPHLEAWDDRGAIDTELWRTAARQGLLGLCVPERFGGGGVDDFRYRCVVMEELARVGAASVNSQVSLVDDLVAPYLVDLATEEQKERWLPVLCTGEATPALAMTEPSEGSDLRGIATTARRDREGWVVNGSKTFITNGGHADLVVTVVRTDPAGGSDAFSLLVLEKGMSGFTTGRSLDKVGQRGEDVSELFFDDVRVPADNLLGVEGSALSHLKQRLPTERMSIAYYALAAAESALDWTLAYVRERTAFGQRIADFQDTRFQLAEMATELDVSRSFLEDAVLALNVGDLTPTDAAKAKWWATELQQTVISRCLQLHGGYGYMREYPIARAFVDARIQTIYGGTTEIMKDIIGRELTR